MQCTFNEASSSLTKANLITYLTNNLVGGSAFNFGTITDVNLYRTEGGPEVSSFRLEITGTDSSFNQPARRNIYVTVGGERASTDGTDTGVAWTFSLYMLGAQSGPVVPSYAWAVTPFNLIGSGGLAQFNGIYWLGFQAYSVLDADGQITNEVYWRTINDIE